MLKKLAPARALDPSHRSEGSWALGTRMAFGVFRVTARVTQLFTFPRRVSEKLMRNIVHGGRLKTICPEMFFDFQAGEGVVNP